MRPRELKALIGRRVEVFWHGQRTGQVVKVPATDTLVVQFHPAIGRHRVSISSLVGVYWRGRRRTLADYLALRDRAGAFIP